MKIMFFRPISFLLSLAVLAIVSNAMSARAETSTSNSSSERFESADQSAKSIEFTETPVSIVDPIALNSTSSYGRSEPAAQSIETIEPTEITVSSVEQLALDSIPSSERSELAAQSVETVELTETTVSSVDQLALDSIPSSEPSELAVETFETVEATETPVSPVDQLAVNHTVTQIPEDTVGQADVQQSSTAAINNEQANSQIAEPEAMGNNQPAASDAANGVSVAKPIPGTLATSAAPLTAQLETPALPEVSSDEADTTVAQNEINIDPGRATRGGSSYVGIGGNIGLGGDTALGSSGFVINGKLGLTRNISFRPAAVIGDNTIFLIPITYDFTIQREDPFAQFAFAPFLGGGVAIATSGDNSIGFLLTGGVDVPLSRQFVANASVNVGFLENATDLGLIVGVGYTFPAF